MMTNSTITKSLITNSLQLRKPEEEFQEIESQIHVYGSGVICDTDTRGYATPRNQSPSELVVDASQGFIPLWAEGVTLRWRFQERSMRIFVDPEAAKTYIKELLGDALLAWGDAAPVKFSQRDDLYDFEIVMRATDRCNASGGCVLASAFFSRRWQT